MNTYVIPYGNCVLSESGSLKHIEERPEYHFLVNTGLYVVEPSVLDFIPSNEPHDMPQLITGTKQHGMEVGVYPIDDEMWIDVGQWDEYRKAVEQL